jgi:hypothetical protein
LHKKLGGYLKIVQSKLTYKCNSQLFLASTYSTFTVFSVKKVSFFLDKFFFDVHCTASVNLGYMEQVDQFVTPKVATALSLDSAQVFSAYFAKFSTFFFLNFTFDGVALSKMLRLNLRMLSFLLFLPDNFLFIQYLGVYFNNTKFRIKYNNIVPIFNIDLKLIFKKKKIFFFKKNHIFLWYLSNFFESKLQKPFFLKILYARAAFNARFIYTICLHIFKKFRRYMFRFKRNFFLGEIIRVVALSLFSKDPTLFLNCIL